MEDHERSLRKEFQENELKNGKGRKRKFCENEGKWNTRGRDERKMKYFWKVGKGREKEKEKIHKLILEYFLTWGNIDFFSINLS